MPPGGALFRRPAARPDGARDPKFATPVNRFRRFGRIILLRNPDFSLPLSRIIVRRKVE
jgi:hypothetical protein